MARTVIVETGGGAGNWLFQLAHGFTYAKRNGATLAYIATSRAHDFPDAMFARFTEWPGSLPDNTVRFCESHDAWSLPITTPWPEPASCVVFSGYFQNRASFEAVLGEFLELLTIPATALVDDICGTLGSRFAFMHIRRGDYLASCNKRIFTELSPLYYQRCMARLPPDMHVVVISNDVAWCKEQAWVTENPRVVLAPPLSTCESFVLMARASCGIVANSTFSLWGALMSGSRISVQAPSQWFQPGRNERAEGICPETWTRVDDLTGDIVKLPIQLGYYINLEHREDRRIEIEAVVRQLNLHCVMRRFPAVLNKEYPNIGCAQSHLTALKQARDSGAAHVLIFEDDLMLTVDAAAFAETVVRFLAWSDGNFDVLCIGSNLRRSQPAGAAFPPGTVKIIEAQVASGYLVNRCAFDELIRCWEVGLENLRRTKQHWKFDCDQSWKTLQPSGKWYTFEPRLCRQRPGFSDISRAFVDRPDC